MYCWPARRDDGFIKAFQVVVNSVAGITGAFVFWSCNSQFVPFSDKDWILHSAVYNKYNPNHNPVTRGFCMRKVPLSKIRPELLQKDGKLVEAFYAGVWGGLGYEFRRSVLSQKHQSPATAHQLWSRQSLQRSSYEVGTQITDQFEVIERKPKRIVLRCGDSTLKQRC